MLSQTDLSHLKATLYIKTIKYKFKRMRAQENKVKIRAKVGLGDEQRKGHGVALKANIHLQHLVRPQLCPRVRRKKK